MYPKDSTSYCRDTGSSMFIAALFTIARKWNQPRCPSTNEELMKMWSVDMIKFYLAIKHEICMKMDGIGGGE